MKLSVIIVNYNVKYFLQQCLQSVQKACKGLDTEVFVVDNNSKDGSVEMVQELFPEVKLIANKDNTGFSKANNQAMRISKGEYVLLLNPDTVVEEETFRKVCSFMDAHEDAGGLGVYMIDGKGNFLPESKRGLPTPAVAFYKIFGLSSLFPKSKVFGKYHLGYLDKNETHEIEVLSGAFMLMRKTALDKVGLLDEDYFMYGEDIDLSYRITKGGYKNYYFADTKIIHYKGESTKKSSVNYVIVFYKAMVIFAKKHFAPGGAALFSFLINMAIWLRAGLAITKRIVERIWLPLVDAVVIYLGMMAIKDYWSINVNVAHYPPFFMQVVVPIYIGIWIVSSYLNGGYDLPVRIPAMVRGLLSGTIVILVGYALLPEDLRFSRALILFGTAWASFSVAALLLLLHASGLRKYRLADAIKKRLMIVGDAEESKRILSMLMMGGNNNSFVGFVSDDNKSKDGSMQNFHLGDTSTFADLISVYEINEVIFCGKNLSSSAIIAMMGTIDSSNIEYKIAPPESLFIIGSNSINENGDFYFVDVANINNPVNKRNKRLFDIGMSLMLFVSSPIVIFIAKNKGGFIQNIFKVLFGAKSWVGKQSDEEKIFKGLKKGVLSPAMMIKTDSHDSTRERLNALYAKDFKVWNDFKLVLRNLKFLGE
ncbi:MAG TPA: glycosyltransferase family 2 protein [Bacteroidia bacterium]|nr:glycosyltransferase family 2 protein [Bacteroidia bacterium]